jgi:flagellar biosynthesis protein FlhA
MESLILARSQYSSHSDLIQAIESDLGRPTSRPVGKAPASRKPTSPDGYFGESRANEITVQLGRGILGLVDPREGKPLFERVESIRMSLAKELGFVLPGVHFVDDLRLDAKGFRFVIRDEVVFVGEVEPGLLLAIGPEPNLSKFRGVRTQDPVYSMPALWVLPELRGECEAFGCMVFTPESVVGTALVETLRKYAGRLFSYGYLSDGVLKALKKDEPELVDYFEDSPKMLKKAKMVFSNLLEEGVPVRDQISILETIVEHEEAEAHRLTEIVRRRLAGVISKLYVNQNGVLPAVVLSKPLEDLCLSCLNEEEQILAPACEHERRKLHLSFKHAVEALRDRGWPEVLIAAPKLRRPLREFIHRHIPTLSILSEDEIPPEVEVACLGQMASRFTKPPIERHPFPRGRRNRARFAKGRRYYSNTSLSQHNQ